jgi:hypothetical protein
LSIWQPAFYGWLTLSLVFALCLMLYVLRGWQLSGVGAQGLLDLARAPGFLIWKVLLMLKPNKSNEWVRTDREGE